MKKQNQEFQTGEMADAGTQIQGHGIFQEPQ
jgi:hypothetical protein